jgi:hypothetical protein
LAGIPDEFHRSLDEWGLSQLGSYAIPVPGIGSFPDPCANIPEVLMTDIHIVEGDLEMLAASVAEVSSSLKDLDVAGAGG